jgi:hypothetical protein
MKVQLAGKAWIKGRLCRKGEVIEMQDGCKPPKGSVVIDSPEPKAPPVAAGGKK